MTRIGKQSSSTHILYDSNFLVKYNFKSLETKDSNLATMDMNLSRTRLRDQYFDRVYFKFWQYYFNAVPVGAASPRSLCNLCEKPI